MPNSTQRLLAIAISIPILGGCTFWSGSSTARLSIPLGDTVLVADRSADLQKQILTMDEAAFGTKNLVSLTLKLSYELGSVPRGT